MRMHRRPRAEPHARTSTPWFQAALAAGPGSPERDALHLPRRPRRGRRAAAEQLAVASSAARPGPGSPNRTARPASGTCTCSTPAQPDFNWDNPRGAGRVRATSCGSGSTGASTASGWTWPTAWSRRPGCPTGAAAPTAAAATAARGHDAPMWDQDGVHEIYREWRRILDEYGRRPHPVSPRRGWTRSDRLARYVRPDEMHQAFNFPYLRRRPGTADRCAASSTESLAALRRRRRPQHLGAVQPRRGPARHPVRLRGRAPRDGTESAPAIRSRTRPRPAPGPRRRPCSCSRCPAAPTSTRARSSACPTGSTSRTTPRQDPTFARTGGERLGRDGCRVPLPWRAGEPHAGFGDGRTPWLPQPESFAELARDAQAASPSSHLNLYRRMLAVRRELGLGRGSLAWAEDWCTDTCLAYLNGTTLVLLNAGNDAVELPAGRVLLRSSRTAPGTARVIWIRPAPAHRLGSGETVWLEIYIEDAES